jgi:small nuclear ribonucleoprotein (snRNP)-like protein
MLVSRWIAMLVTVLLLHGCSTYHVITDIPRECSECVTLEDMLADTHGKTVTVTLNDGPELVGLIVETNPQNIVLINTENRTRNELANARIKKITYTERGLSLAGGLVLGVGFGAVLGISSSGSQQEPKDGIYREDPEMQHLAYLVVGTFGLVGAIAGYAVGIEQEYRFVHLR